MTKMRTVILCVLCDIKAGTFGTPCVFSTESDAERGFGDLVADKNTIVGKHPADFRLVKIADYEVDSAIVKPCDHLVIADGRSYEA